jgi:hypothetical protein
MLERPSNTHIRRTCSIGHQSYQRSFVAENVSAKTAQGEIAHFKTELIAQAINSRPTANLIGDYDNVKAHVERRCDPQDGSPQ